ncbi:hypothetical protein ACIGO8_30890 [Streptomyces sp. NPDC053493]|uniref:hypothetical protein n=1 Tax=Streptomyces sp. NPDC053493 TaxID=3365705 RepID=UPI0037D8798A
MRPKSVFTDRTTDLTLTGRGTSEPETTPAGTVRTATKDVLPMRHEPGKALDLKHD